MNTAMPIPVFVPNLKRRTDRKESIMREFEGREEFSLHVVEAIEHQIGAIGLWQTIIHILEQLVSDEDDFIIFCEDDHYFTSAYSTEKLLHAINIAGERNADLLMGGVSGFSSVLPVAGELYWVEKFSGLQFTVIFRRFFQRIINAPMEKFHAADYHMSDLTTDKMLIYPAFSAQKEFGYSDATPKNAEAGKVTQYFEQVAERLQILNNVSAFYSKMRVPETASEDYSNICIPVYLLINEQEQTAFASAKKTFSDRKEFEHRIINNQSAHPIAALQECVADATAQDDDIIIICREGHLFSDAYAKDYLLQNIIAAYQQGAALLAGDAEMFGFAMPISENRYWVNEVKGWHLLVIFSKVFRQILDEPWDNDMLLDDFLSTISSNKMLLYPFISQTTDNLMSTAVWLPPPQQRLLGIRNAYNKYLNETVCM